MKPVMWGEPGGTIRWQPQRNDGKRLWEDYGYFGRHKFGTYWAQKPEGQHDTPVRYRSHALANVRAWIGNRSHRKEWKQL